MFAIDPGYTRTLLVEQTAEQAGLDASDAHPPDVPARAIADLIEGDLEATTGRVFRTLAHGPVLVADSRRPMPYGEVVPLRLKSVED